VVLKNNTIQMAALYIHSPDYLFTVLVSIVIKNSQSPL